MNQSMQSAAADTAPGLAEYLGVIKKRRRILLMVAVPIIALAAMLAVLLPDEYRSQGRIEIEDAQTNPRNVARDGDSSAQYADQYVQSLSTLVLSDRNLRRLLEAQELYPGEEQQSALARLRSDINVNIVTVPILDPITGRERKIVTAFTVAYENQDPERAHAGATWLVDAYLEQNRRDRQRDAANTAQFYAGEAERMGKRVAELEAKLANFKSENAGQLPELNQVNLNVMDRTETEMRNVETQIQALRRERVFLLSQLQQARAAGPETTNVRQLEEEYKRRSAQYDESHPDLIALRRQIDTLKRGGSLTGMSLRAQLQNQQAILSEARQRYSDDHPDVRRIVRNIESLQARIDAGETADRSLAADSPVAIQLQTQLNATDTQIAALEGRNAELRLKMTDLEGRMQSAPMVEREFQAVTRDLASARAKYDELMKRQLDAEVNESAIAGGTAEKFRVTSNPSVPDEPAKPKRLAILLVGLVLGIGAGISTVVAAQLFDRSVRGTRDVQEILGVLPLTAVPVIQNSGSLALRRRDTLRFALGTVAGVSVIYFILAQFVL